MEFKNYDELQNYIKTHEHTLILDYGDDFKVYLIEGYYWYWDGDDIREVNIIAELQYDIFHDINADGDALSNLFDSYCCGEFIYDGGISYIWFEEVEYED